ncbi:MAG: hypothetical protein RR138_07230, partial [Akkermansia sp.]
KIHLPFSCLATFYFFSRFLFRTGVSLTVQTKQLSYPSKIIFAKMDTFYSMPGIYNAGDTYDVLEHKSIHLVGTESITTEHHTRV